MALSAAFASLSEAAMVYGDIEPDLGFHTPNFFGVDMDSNGSTDFGISSSADIFVIAG
jgi:hypothetical protein